MEADRLHIESTESSSTGNSLLPVSEKDDQFDKDFDDVIRAIDSDAQDAQALTLPADFSVNDLLRSLSWDKPVAAPQFRINTILADLPPEKVEWFCKMEFIFITKTLEDLNISEPRAAREKELLELYTRVHRHLIGFEYRLNCMSVFDYSRNVISNEHWSICFNCHQAVRKYLLQQETTYTSKNRVEKTSPCRKHNQIAKEKKEKVGTVQDDQCPSTSGLSESAARGRQKKRKNQRFVRVVNITPGSYLNGEGETILACPHCGVEEDRIQPMICCDECHDWFHWLCVGISEEPAARELWFCRDCKRSGNHQERKPKEKHTLMEGLLTTATVLEEVC